MTDRKKTDISSLAKKAVRVRDRAYSPYSNHPVGAVIVTDSGKIYMGANVESAHYKGICAEASAIAAMVSAGERKIRMIVIASPSMEHICTPCGDCRQRIREFSDKETRIHSVWADGSPGGVMTIDELLPHSFGPSIMASLNK